MRPISVVASFDPRVAYRQYALLRFSEALRNWATWPPNPSPTFFNTQLGVPGKRHQARELALKVLFQLENRDEDAAEVLAYHAADSGAPDDVASFAADLVKGVLANREQLDDTIRAAATNWTLEQMAKVDRIVLRIAVYEITISRNVPVKAAINESIELAKTFSGDESGRFVNGILGRVAEGVA